MLAVLLLEVWHPRTSCSCTRNRGEGLAESLKLTNGSLKVDEWFVSKIVKYSGDLNIQAVGI